MKKFASFALALMALVALNSCDKIEKMSERKVDVPDFEIAFHADQTGAAPQAPQAVSLSRSESRATYPYSYSGTYTVLFNDLVPEDQRDFNTNLIKAIQIGQAVLEVLNTGISDKDMELTLSAPGITPLTINGKFSAINSAVNQQKAITFVTSAFMKVMTAKSLVITIDASTNADISTLDLNIDLSQIVITAGLNI